MNEYLRPKICPALLSQIVEQVPGRLRKRLDNEPGIAESWDWKSSEDEWIIEVNDETVRLRGHNGLLSQLCDVECTCLLAPKCFHLIACCSLLELDSSPTAEVPHPSLPIQNQVLIEEAVESSSTVEVTESMRAAAKLVSETFSELLRAGARNAGVLMQSGLLRAGHSCRAVELYALSNTVLRVVEGVQRIRRQTAEADSVSLKEDIANAFLASHTLLRNSIVPRWIAGQSRRLFEIVDIRKLRGVFAEPILTRSGYAGVSVYLQEERRGELYTVNELRNGDASLIHQAYRGGIDLGGITLEASTICRSDFAVQELTVSSDRRLGKGKSTRWASIQRASYAPFSDGRFSQPVATQLERIFDWLQTPKEERPHGWDVIALTGRVVGASGHSVVFDVVGANRPWRLGIMVDSVQLEYRHNLEMIARCPRLGLRMLARVRELAPYFADVLAIANTPFDSSQTLEEPRLELPEEWGGICNVGLDRLERHYVRGVERWASEIDLGNEIGLGPLDTVSKFTSAIERRLQGIVLGGSDSVPIPSSKTHRRDMDRLSKSFLTTGARLLDQLATKACQGRLQMAYRSNTEFKAREEFAAAFLACEVYNQASLRSLTKAQWTKGSDEIEGESVDLSDT